MNVRALLRSPRRLLVGAALSLLALSPLALSQSSTPASAKLSPDAERGRYLVSILGCNDCHTPLKWGEHGPQPDMTRFLTGHPEGTPLGPPPAPSGGWMWAGDGTNTAFAGPWGITYAINLTPDDNTGIGIWTEKMFVDSMKTGKHMGTSRPIMPPMPWETYRNMTDADVKAVYAYLRTLKPAKNRVPDWAEPKGPPRAAAK